MSLILWHLGSTSPSKHNGSSSETTYQMLPGTSFPYRDLLRRNRKKRNTPISCSLKALSLYIFEPTAQFLYFFFVLTMCYVSTIKCLFIALQPLTIVCVKLLYCCAYYRGFYVR